MASPSSVGLVASTTSSYALARPAALGRALQQLAHLEPVGADAVHRRDRAVEHVVAARKAPVRSIASTSSGSSTTQTRVWSRDGSAQIGHSGPVEMLKHDSQ